MGYYKKALGGITWMGVLRGSTRVFAYVKIAILARILNPLQFGLFGIASLSLSFLETITETGINIFFIQGGGKIRDYIDTAWVISILRGTILSAVLLFATPLISMFFKSPEAKTLLYTMSVIPFLRGFINPAIVRFRRDLNFNKEFGLRLSVSFSQSLSTIIFALLTKSAISMIYGMILGVMVELAYSLLFIKPRPRFVFDKTKIRRVVKRGKWVTLAGIFNYFFREGDDMVVGRILDKASLGIYQVAYKISSLPLTEVSQIVQSVVFPVYSKFSKDKERLKRAFVKSVIAVFLIVFPIGFVFYVFPTEIVTIILGSKWLDAVGIVRILAFFGVLRSMTSITFPLLLSRKKQEYITYVTLVGIFFLGISVVPLVLAFQVKGAAYSALIGATAALPVSYYFVLKALK